MYEHRTGYIIGHFGWHFQNHLVMLCLQHTLLIFFLVNHCASGQGTAISLSMSILAFEPTGLDLFCICMDHDHSSSGMESRGHTAKDNKDGNMAGLDPQLRAVCCLVP